MLLHTKLFLTSCTYMYVYMYIYLLIFIEQQVNYSELKQ